VQAHLNAYAVSSRIASFGEGVAATLADPPDGIDAGASAIDASAAAPPDGGPDAAR
jgi:hypothetical protein